MDETKHGYMRREYTAKNKYIKTTEQASTPQYRSYRMSHEVQMWKGRSKIGAVNVGLSRTLWEEEAMTARTEYIYSIVPWQV